MKKTILAASILAITTSVALAQGPSGDNNGAGEVIFTGEVKAASCEITVGGQKNNATVKLPIINANEFEAPNTKYKRTNFNIVLSKCNLGDNQDTVSVSWADSQLDDTAKGYLTNLLSGQQDAAKGVSLVISDDEDRNIVPGTHAENYSNSSSTVSAKYDNESKSATIPFTVAYVTSNISAVEAGKVKSSAVYSVFYE